MKDINFAGNSKSAVDILGKEWHYECMGCAIGKGEVIVPGGAIFEGKTVLLGADPEIPIPGFLIVNVKKHVRSFSEFSREERIEIADVIACAEKALRELNITNEVTLVQEERSKHFHLWIFPHYDWMTEKFGKGINYLRAISEYAREHNSPNNINEVLNVVERVRKYFSEHDIKQ